MYRILITDDTRSWLFFHMGVIRELYGDVFEITTARCAMEALEIVKNNEKSPFDIIITDLQMEDAFDGELAGEWLVEQIKLIKEYSKTKIIMVSAMYNIEMIAKRQNVDYISKNMLVRNKLLMKYMFEKLIPDLPKI